MLDVVISTFGEEGSFISQAKELGFTKLLILYEKTTTLTDEYLIQLQKNTDLKLSFGILGTSKSKLKQISKKVVLGTSKFQLTKDVDYLYDLEYLFDKDHLHQRKSGANEVLLKQLKDIEAGVLVSLSHLRSQAEEKQGFLLGHIIQNGLLAQKISTDFFLVSFARSTTNMRHSKDVLGLCRTLGFHS